MFRRRRQVMRLVGYPPGTPWWRRFWYRFRPPPPPPYRPLPQNMPWMPPDDEKGVPVPMLATIAAGADAVVLLNSCLAFTKGFELGVGIRRRVDPPPIFARDPRRARPHEPDEMTLVLGVRFADGRESSRAGRGPSRDTAEFYKAWAAGQEPPVPAGPGIGPMTFGGGGRRWDSRYWIWPLPPPGMVTITCEWPAGGIAHSEVEVDGDAIREAGLRSEKLWVV